MPVAAFYLVLFYGAYTGSFTVLPMADAEHCQAGLAQFAAPPGSMSSRQAYCIASGLAPKP